MLAQLLSLALYAAPAAAAAAPWARGQHAVLSFDGDGAGYSFNFTAGTTFASTPGSLANVTASKATDGLADPALGGYDELNLTVGRGGVLSVRYFAGLDAFVFVRAPTPADPEHAAAFPAVWPSFSIAGHNDSATRCLGWDDHYFFPGGISTSLSGCKSNGPLFLFEAPSYEIPPPPSAAMVLSALSHFTSNQAVNCPRPKKGAHGVPIDSCTLGVSGAVGQCKACRQYSTSALMLARPSLQRSIRAFGSVVRQKHATARLRGEGVNQLSAWNDNQAAYSWWTVGPDQEVWGKPEDLYVKLKQGYDAAGIPVKSWEPDNNWIVTYKDGNEFGNGSGVAKNWIGRQWDYNEELYPSGGEGFVAKMGNISMVYYTNGFNQNNSYREQYRMVGRGEMEPHPTESERMYGDLIGNASRKYNMEMLFTDFLCYRGPAMGSFQDVPDGEEGEHMWLGGQMKAAQAHGVEVQMCMALAHQILMSVEWPSVTNCRVNGDGGLAVDALVLPSVLAGAVGLGWSKDNLRTADRCYVDGLYPNGSVKWPCGSINAAEGTSGKYSMQTQQTMLATLSLGPVGIADQLSARPDNASAHITSNKVLVMGTTAATGDLLQPSYPLTPVERMLTGAGGMGQGQGGAGMDCFGARHIPYSFGCGVYLMATYTAVPTTSAGASGRGEQQQASASSAAAAAAPLIFYTALGFHTGKSSGAARWTLLFEQDLAPMVDGHSPPAPTIAAIPGGAFAGAGASFSEASNGSATEHVMWFGDFVHQTSACHAVTISTWEGKANMSLPLGDGTTQVNIAPLLNGAALLGEAGKVTAVSAYRFSSITAAGVGGSGGGITVGLRGKPGEVVELMFAVGGHCVAKPTTIGADGTAVAHSG